MLLAGEELRRTTPTRSEEQPGEYGRTRHQRFRETPYSPPQHHRIPSHPRQHVFPTLPAPPDTKDEFYNKLETTISINSFFRTKTQHKVSWRHPCSKHWHQLDLILVRRAAIKNVLHTRTYHSADCDTDHSLVCCKIKLQHKRFHRGKNQGKPRIDVSKMSQPDFVQQFVKRYENELATSRTGHSATEKWATLWDTMHRTALVTFGRTTGK
ncbi:unnamed protein product [Acanthosepion pharaonis]|uniref:Uncharacterized protein n=1 Tax=Acanthosepion pharaonis TaxID=158019 RepID=A0A812DSF4_ACAPH|nr:unnamed protein product [Sepia pharaonis]